MSQLKLKRGSPEYFEWWENKIKIFEEKYPFARVIGFDPNLLVDVREQKFIFKSTSFEMSTIFFLNMIGETNEPIFY